MQHEEAVAHRAVVPRVQAPDRFPCRRQDLPVPGHALPGRVGEVRQQREAQVGARVLRRHLRQHGHLAAGVLRGAQQRGDHQQRAVLVRDSLRELHLGQHPQWEAGVQEQAGQEDGALDRHRQDGRGHQRQHPRPRPVPRRVGQHRRQQRQREAGEEPQVDRGGVSPEEAVRPHACRGMVSHLPLQRGRPGTHQVVAHVPRRGGRIRVGGPGPAQRGTGDALGVQPAP